jgi:myosin-5
VDGEDDAARVCFGDARAALKISAKLLGVRPDALEKALTTRVLDAGGESVTKRLDASKAFEARDAFAKATYASLFEWLVRRVNDRFSQLENVSREGTTSSSWTTSFAVLDIYGFETFETNSFEQLCINYANEKLQQRFNEALFTTEQEEYAREGIDWTKVSFEDNQKCVDVIDGKAGKATNFRNGVLALLDEQCAFPKSTDATFARACAAALGKDDAPQGNPFKMNKRDPDSFFTIAHYAGDVTYDVSGFIAKNKDEVPESALELLETAKEPFANALAATARLGRRGFRKTKTKQKKPQTSKSKESLRRRAFQNSARRAGKEAGRVRFQIHPVRQAQRCSRPGRVPRPKRSGADAVLRRAGGVPHRATRVPDAVAFPSLRRAFRRRRGGVGRRR